jgi:hypothetical protein
MRPTSVIVGCYVRPVCRIGPVVERARSMTAVWLD